MKNLVPLTSLPRSGSTLLMNILAQNSLFCVGQDSELSYVIAETKKNIEEFTISQQVPYQNYQQSVLNFCIEGTKGWINTFANENQYFLDKSRGWIINVDYIYKVFPNLKSICVIRDLRGIVNSFEKIHNNSLSVNKNNFNYNLNENFLRQRIDGILNLWYIRDTLFSIKELIDIPKSYTHNILFVKYEQLISDPETVLQQIYQFLEIKCFDHDFNNIEQIAYNDNVFQPYGCHKIKNKVESIEQIYSELNDDALNYILENYQWYYEEFYPEIF